MDKLVNNRKNNGVIFFILVILIILVVPLLLISSYEWLGGGILNGIWGSWRTAIIDPSLLLVIGASSEAILFFVLCFVYTKYLKFHRKKTLQLALATGLVILAAAVTLVMVFWRTIKT